MATTAFGSSDAQTVQHWSTKLFVETLPNTLFRKFVVEGNDEYSIIQILDELKKTRGDTIKYDLLMKMTGAGVEGDDRLKGSEEAMTYHQDELKIDQLRHGHSFKRMSQQRTVHGLREHGKKNLAKWWEEKWDNYMFRYLCGDTTLSFAGNSGKAPDSDHYIVSGDVTNTGTIATDEGNLGANDVFRLEDIDYAKETAETISPKLEPTRIDGDDYYVVVVHPYAWTDLKLNLANSTKISWKEIMEYAHVRGLKNPIFSGAQGVYNGCIIYTSNYIYEPVSNVRRNLFLGRQAGVFGLGNAYIFDDDQQKYGKMYFTWAEEKDDYGNERGVAAGSVFGMKACRFNSKNFGAMVMTSYAAAHNS